MSCTTILKNASDLDKRCTTQHMIIVSTNPFVDARFYLKIFMDAVSLLKDVNVVMCINCHVTVKSILIIVVFWCCKYIPWTSVKIIIPVIIIITTVVLNQSYTCEVTFLSACIAFDQTLLP